MTAVATVRVRCREGKGSPARPDLEETAFLLEKCGFSVKRIGRFGVSIEGDEATFSHTLGVELGVGEALVEVPKPGLEPLARLIDLVEVTPPPEYFGI